MRIWKFSRKADSLGKHLAEAFIELALAREKLLRVLLQLFVFLHVMHVETFRAHIVTYLLDLFSMNSPIRVDDAAVPTP